MRHLQMKWSLTRDSFTQSFRS